MQNILQSVSLSIVGGSQCIDYATYVSPAFVCAGQTGAGPCTFDDGAPLLFKVNGTWTVYGVASDPSGCGAAGTYGVFTNVGSYYSFLFGQDVGRSDGKLYGGYLCASPASMAQVSMTLLAMVLCVAGFLLL